MIMYVYVSDARPQYREQPGRHIPETLQNNELLYDLVCAKIQCLSTTVFEFVCICTLRVPLQSQLNLL